MTTDSRNNSYVQDGMLYIVPTLTEDNIGHNAVFDGTVYNIPEFAKAFNCSAKAKVCHLCSSFHLTLRSTTRS